MNGKQNWEVVYFWRGLGLFLLFITIIISITVYLRPDTLDSEGLYRAREGRNPHALVSEEEKKNTSLLNAGKKYFVGLYLDERLAIYEKIEDGRVVLLELLPYLVKEVHYTELRKGIYFSTEEEKEAILEYLTS